MKANYDLEPIEVTDRFINALNELMAVECEMMQRNNPSLADAWTWGRCHINDLAQSNGLEFEFGGDEDFPADGLDRFAVVNKKRRARRGAAKRKERPMQWKDTTSYSREKERIPTCWSVKAGKLRITVLSSHIYYRGRWVMHCKPFYDTHELNVETKEEAQAKAIELVQKEIEAIVVDLSSGAAIQQPLDT